MCRPSQHARTFSSPSKSLSDCDPPCSSNSSSSVSCPFADNTCSNDRVGLYGLSGVAHRRYSAAGVPLRLPREPLTESWERLRFPRGVVLTPLWLLRSLRWLWGLESTRWRWSSSVNSALCDMGLVGTTLFVLRFGDATAFGLGRAKRYLRA